MALVVEDTITSANVSITDTIIQSSSLVSESNTIHLQSEVPTDGSTSSTFSEDINSIDGTIYRALSSQNDMKTIQYPSRIKNEFDLFWQYAEAHYNGTVNTGFDKLNNYLGTLGVSNEWIY